MAELSGHCLCGAITWSYTGPISRRLACHCTDCQRATSAPFTTFVGLDPALLHWQGAPNHYQSSLGTWRGFCPSCGTRLYFRSNKWPGEIHIHATTLTDPAGYKPDAHVMLADSPNWLRLADDIPKYVGFHAQPAKPD